jgi:hypothetical protein
MCMYVRLWALFLFHLVLCVCICFWVRHACVDVFAYTCMFLCEYVCPCIYEYVNACICICMYSKNNGQSAHFRAQIHTYVYIHTHTHPTYIYTYMHTHIKPQSGIVQKKGFTNGEALFLWLIQVNEELSRIPDSSWAPKRRTRGMCLYLPMHYRRNAYCRPI